MEKKVAEKVVGGVNPSNAARMCQGKYSVDNLIEQDDKMSIVKFKSLF